MASDRPPWLDCHACQLHFHHNREHLMAACATVAIEAGADKHQMLRLWLDGYHRDGHREPEPSGAVSTGEDPTTEP